MAIDKRGMGLTIHCPECDGLVKVPTVSESDDEDAHEVSMPVEGLADALEQHRVELEALKEKLASVEKLRDQLETQTQNHEEKLTQLRREFGNIQSALDQVTMLLVETGDS
jgi:septal ring factor EnvC (AmiA/AmiB activator)